MTTLRLSFALAVVAAIGCASSTTPTAPTGAVTFISTPCAPSDTPIPKYPVDTSTTPGSGAHCAPVCTERARDTDNFFFEDALPSGACSGTQTCELAARTPCACGGQGSLDVYRCACAGGAWTCTDVGQGGATCVACP